ncbi:lipopolysaccharide biosynthesis protein [Iamia sp. SCSIO 61187]|uniref:lipopolysaccharide biosynthesis protein n=1 Tax=Iamia sp. SCSIO 61187 TaxID=2722752 RepID=UPI001C626139|nr:lipopolysaccharide biosynthesis protein [Iamia sp. SCSIO 61187]QYG94945.1 lipopolysaccharide biosynthesis protein [Iamia sp. SCSIO 61187]
MASGIARARLKRAKRHRHLLEGSALLVVGAAIQAGSGAIFWLIAAKLDVEADVGSAAKLSQSILFVTYLASLGLPVALARYAADRDDDSDTTFTWAVIATSTIAGILGLGYVAVLHSSATDVLTDWDGLLGPLVFAATTIGAALSMIADVRCMTARRWNLVMFRITLVGLVRFPLLFLARDHGHRALWLFVFSSGPVALSGYVGAFLAPRFAGGRMRLGPRPAAMAQAIRYSAVNYLSTLAYQAPYFALPVIVLASVSSESYASFNVAWGIVAVAFYVPTALGQALLAEGGRDGARLRSQVRLALVLALGLMVAGAMVTAVGRDIVTAVYGDGYSDAARVLPAMVAAGIPWAITSLLLSEVRILHRHSATVAITLALTAAIVIPALLLVPEGGLSPDGIDGASISWLIGNVVAAVVAIAASRISHARGQADPTVDDDPALDEPGTAADATEVGITLDVHSA